MKVINVMLEDKEHAELMKKKGKLTWKQALIDGCEKTGEGVS